MKALPWPAQWIPAKNMQAPSPPAKDWNISNISSYLTKQNKQAMTFLWMFSLAKYKWAAYM